MSEANTKVPPETLDGTYTIGICWSYRCGQQALTGKGNSVGPMAIAMTL